VSDAPPGAGLDAMQRRIVHATQAGLPLAERPYAAVASDVGTSEADVMRCLAHLLETGAVRRIAAVPNHYALGYVANGMSVWDVEDEAVDECGRTVGALDFVSHCYRRPRRPPRWPYNLFAMVHARSREAVEERIDAIASLLGAHCRCHDVLYSTEVLKKTGQRLRG